MAIKRIGDVEEAAVTRALTTGIAGLDAMKGLRDECPDLVIIGGRPGMGKTYLLLQISAQIAAQGKGVLMFSIEMPATQMKARLDKMPKIDLASIPLYIDDRSVLNVQDIYDGAAEVLDAGEPLSLICVDYLQIMAGTGRSKAEEVGGIMASLKGIAKALNVPILVLAQLNRAIDSRNEGEGAEFIPPRMSDFADSSEIEKWADGLYILHKRKETDNATKLYCVKWRHGAKKDIELMQSMQNQFFTEVKETLIRAVHYDY